jgi:predicted nuclease of restriction endonuclease-like (RecB) superfamily
MRKKKGVLAARSSSSSGTASYARFITTLKEKVRSAQLKAVLSVNRELIQLYWEIGQEIAEKQEKEDWGSKVIERVAIDLQSEFRGTEGFSARNVWRMRAFYKAYREAAEILPQLVAELGENGLPQSLSTIPWGHNIVLLEKLNSLEERVWYARMVLEEGWSRNELIGSIGRKWYKRYGKAITNFDIQLPNPQSHLAQQTLKDPLHFDFLGLKQEHDEKELEDGLLDHIEKFMRELGQGFTFYGRQVPIEVGGKNFLIDLLFYHVKLRCYVVVDLKATDFKPEFAGKMNFYLTAVDEHFKHPTDNPSIGLLICQRKNDFIAEYALRDIRKPMGVVGYETQIVESLPKKLEGQLPSVSEIEEKLNRLLAKETKNLKKQNKKKRFRK